MASKAATVSTLPPSPAPASPQPPGDDRQRNHVRLYQFLSEEKIFAEIYRIQHLSAVLHCALDSSMATEFMPYLAGQAAIIHDVSEELTECLVIWLLEHDIFLPPFTPRNKRRLRHLVKCTFRNTKSFD